MIIRFWGVRGAIATPGKDFLHYGGNTSAIELRANSGHRVLVDLGTGITEFAKELMSAEFGQGKGHLPVLLTHTHIDHIQGLPFFVPFFIKGNTIRIMGAKPTGIPLEQVLQGQLNGHYSPLYGLENLAAGVEVQTLGEDDTWSAEGFEVKAMQMKHGRMSVMAFRIEADGKSVVIMTDVEHETSGISDKAIAWAQNCDLLVHDAMFSDSEYKQRTGWGHSSLSSALAAAKAIQTKRLALFHHSPDSSDPVISSMIGAVSKQSQIPVFAAREGIEISV